MQCQRLVMILGAIVALYCLTLKWFQLVVGLRGHITISIGCEKVGLVHH